MKLKTSPGKFGDLTAVDNLTLRVNEGEVFGLLEPNGAGKTITVKMLSCLISKKSGTTRIGDSRHRSNCL